MATYKGIPVAYTKHDIAKDEVILFGHDGIEVARMAMNYFRMNPTLKQVPHGKHRRSNPKNNGSATGQSGGANQGAPTFTFTDPNDPYSFDLSPGAINYASYGTSPAHLSVQMLKQAMDQMQQQILSTFMYSSLDINKPIPHEGIIAREIIGHRAWEVVREHNYMTNESTYSLTSMYVKSIWQPSKTMEGDINKYGVHAFKSSEKLEHYYQDFAIECFMRSQTFCYAIGTCALWGEVVEHERGYRAERGRIYSLDEIITNDSGLDRQRLLHDLRSIYNLGPKA